METHLAGRLYPGTREDIIFFMDSVGYTHMAGAHSRTNTARSSLGTTDDLFVRKDVTLRGREEL